MSLNNTTDCPICGKRLWYGICQDRCKEKQLIESLKDLDIKQNKVYKDFKQTAVSINPVLIAFLKDVNNRNDLTEFQKKQSEIN